MRLSEINKETLTDNEIENIVFDGIYDSGENADYALVFGNSNLIKERVTTAVEAFRSGRVKKLIFSGGNKGISNQDDNQVSEAERMCELALEMGINKEDFLIEDKANNTFENIENVLKIIPDVTRLVIITSEFHLKRCYAILKKYKPNLEVIMIPSLDGQSDKANWYLSENFWNSGRSLVTFEANVLIKYAKEGKIIDLEIPNI